MPTSYYNLKHFIIPDVDYGVIKCLKVYNLLVLIFCLFSEAKMMALIYRNSSFEWIVAIIMGAVILAILPAVKRGMDKWTS